MRMTVDGRLAAGFQWIDQPRYRVDGEAIVLSVEPDTDWWQRTHYGFRRDNAHCLVTEVDGNVAVVVRASLAPRSRFDQAGLVVRYDEGHWLKCSCEFETPMHGRIGSVVTNAGYSDWATVDLEPMPDSAWYRVSAKGDDYLIEWSRDGEVWRQQRIARLHRPASATRRVGIYACSPMPDGGFEARFDQFAIGPSAWKAE